MNHEHLLFALLLQLLSFSCFCQATFNISGTVIDHDSGVGVEFATVSLLNAIDSNLITGTVAGTNGAFEISKISKGKLVLLQASFIGYESVYSDAILVDRNASNLTLHLRSGAQILREIEVTGKKLTDIHRLDRQEFDADQFTNAAGASAVQLIGNLPAVSVNGQGEITVRGATGFLLLIDGRPVQTDPAAMLAQLPANAIEKVEIITTPGAKYDPDGKAGILNITTKSGSLQGWSAAANLNLGLPAIRDFDAAEPQRRYAADFSANYRTGKLDIGLGADYRSDDTGGQRDGYVNTITDLRLEGATLTEFPSFGERSHDRENYSGRLSVNYAPSSNTALRAGLFAGKRTVHRTADILYRDQTRSFLPFGGVVGGGEPIPESYFMAYQERGNEPNEGVIENQRTFFNENLRVRRGDFFIATLDYERKLSRDRKISVSGLYERTVLGGPTDNTVLDFPSLADTLQYQFNTNDNPLDGYRFNADYSAKIGEATWENGYQFRYLKHPGEFLYLDRDFANNRFVTNPEFTNGILLRRDVHAVYSQVSGASKKLQYSAGLRLEYFDRTVRLNQPDTTYRLDRLGLYPSANLKYQLSEGLSAKAGYSRRIDRTTTFKMTPFPEREHNETLEQGDAELLPELTDLFEVGLVSNFGDNSAFATAYYRHTRDVINRVNTIYNDTILNRIYTNVGNANALGLELGLTVFPVDDWRIYLGGNIFNYQLNGSLFGDEVTTSNWVYSINTATDLNLFSFADLQIGVNYLSERVTVQGSDGRFFNPYLSLRREFPQQRLTITFQWQNISLGIWDNNQQRITTSKRDFYTTTNYIYETDILRLGVGYQFTKLKKDVKVPKSEFGDKEF
ncbi:TonB-dependent receptor domain-containing protein [Neolewinella persica]|uniref:TonB-dependent receptor domain-containing protein n=1 Tax=Neolewinella persica TaxID=70998 RepID=UPI00037FFAB6|nr:TonB-dependent receptor [Neolewinella persica]